jgi:hypothetical protein
MEDKWQDVYQKHDQLGVPTFSEKKPRITGVRIVWRRVVSRSDCTDEQVPSALPDFATLWGGWTEAVW